MTDLLLYQKKIAHYQRRDLMRLWREIQKGDVLKPIVRGKAFEYLVIRAFELEGAEVRWPYSVRFEEQEVEQVDGVIYSDGLACLIECKCQDMRKPVNFEVIAKLRNQLLRRPPATLGCIFSRSGFTIPAGKLAHTASPQNILLWTGLELEYALQNKFMRHGLTAKFQHCVEHGFPDYNITERSLP